MPAQLQLFEPATTPAPRIFPSGSLRLDWALRTGGLLGGQICEVFGLPACGKTTFGLSLIASAQHSAAGPEKGTCAFIDTEGALDIQHARSCGVDLDRLVLCRPDCAEAALDMVGRLAGSGAVEVIVLDSLTALLPKAEQLAPLGEGTPRALDSLLANRMPHLKRVAQRNGVLLVFTSQLQDPASPIFFGAQKSTIGLAVKLQADLRLELRLAGRLEQACKPVGDRLQIQIIKWKELPASRAIEIVIMYNEGVFKTGEIFDLAREFWIIRPEAGGLFYQGRCLGIDREASLKTLQSAPGLVEQIEQVVRTRLFPP